MKRYFILFFAAVLLVGCAVQPINTPQAVPTSKDLEATKAFHTLANFFSLLHSKSYAEAVLLYGGEYEPLQVFNPEINSNDHVALWAWARENQLLQCLEVRSAELAQEEADTYIFQVEFNNPDGSLIVLGPCCGANETEMPPISQFEFTVTRNSEGKFVVMNMPPYVP